MNECEHLGRLKNLAAAHAALGPHASWHCVQGYLPGQVVYNLGEYPERFSIAPTEEDADLLTRLAASGVELVQIHEEYTDSQRLLGADKLSCHDPAGLRRFVDLVHRLGMKILPYVSSGFFDVKDPDFREAFHDAGRSRLVEIYFDYAHCSPASPEWRAYLLPRIERLLDEYGFDGMYNDVGYDRSLAWRALPDGQASPAPWPHAAYEDLLGLLYDMAHRRGGLVKVHGGPYPLSRRVRVYDYLWLGEGVESMDLLRRQGREADPYVVPCPDMSRARVVDEHDLYLYTIPYLQFPLRVDGRPFTGKRALVEGVRYQPEERCFWTRHCRTIWRHAQEHPEGPHTYGWWDSTPGRPEARETWLDYLRLYRPMVSSGSHVWIDLREGALFARAPAPELTASLFVNEETYLVAANHGSSPATFASPWQWRDRRSGRRAREWSLPPRGLLFLARAEG